MTARGENAEHPPLGVGHGHMLQTALLHHLSDFAQSGFGPAGDDLAGHDGGDGPGATRARAVADAVHHIGLAHDAPYGASTVADHDEVRIRAAEALGRFNQCCVLADRDEPFSRGGHLKDNRSCSAWPLSYPAGSHLHPRAATLWPAAECRRTLRRRSGEELPRGTMARRACETSLRRTSRPVRRRADGPARILVSYRLEQEGTP